MFSLTASSRLFGLRELVLLGACCCAFVCFAVLSPNFATADNLSFIFRNSVELLLIGLGITLIMALGGIDVSVGAVMGISAIVIGKLLLAGVSIPLVVLAGVLTGATVGLATALLVVVGGIPAIVGTIGLLGVYRALIFLLLGGSWLSGLPTDLSEVVQLEIFGIGLPFLLILALYSIAYMAIQYTPFGPRLFAIGDSESKARLAGLKVLKLRFSVYVISGILCGIAAVYYVGTYRNVEMTIGSTIALEAIAAVVIGGTSILGGNARLLGTFLGVILIKMLQNGLLLVGLPSLWQVPLIGGLILLVLCLDKGFEKIKRTFAARRVT